MERDRDTIGLSPENAERLKEIEARGWFQERQEIALFCMSYALRANVAEGQISGTETRWAAGNFDRTGEIRGLLSVFYPTCKFPVRLMEYLVNEGIRLVWERLKSPGVGPAELLETTAAGRGQ
jgi:hypothetical protein